MALHGTIMVNDHGIADWQAVNLDGRMYEGAKNRYRCRVRYCDQRGYWWFAEFLVKHNYSDGAVALAGQVLTKTPENLQPVRLDDEGYPVFPDSRAKE